MLKVYSNNGKIYVAGRIDSNNAAEFEKQTESFIDDNEKIILDFSKVEYISSAGLRVLLKIRKMFHSLKIENANSDVSEVLQMTGFAGFIDVNEPRRTVSVRGLPVVGVGASATVYRLDDDKIIKVFLPEISYDLIARENEITRNAFQQGIETMVAYDIVETEEGIGAIYEDLQSIDLIACMRGDHAKVGELITNFGRFVHKSHQTILDSSIFGKAKDETIHAITQAEKMGITQEESDKLVELIRKVIPDSNHFTHGDCHAGNVMFKNGKYQFIDVGRMSCGHAIFDLTSMFVQYRWQTYNHINTGITSPLARDFSEAECQMIWENYFREVTGIKEETLIVQAEKQINVIAGIRMLSTKIYREKLLPEVLYRKFVDTALMYYDLGCESLCF